MNRFRVWAPQAGTVSVQVDGREYSLQAEDNGWWSGVVEGAGPGSNYAFILDGGKPLPDPRSPWQPEGPHGPSRLVDHQAFEWHDQGWDAPPLDKSIFYELHTGTFTPEGTFTAAIEHLDELAALGITHIELMPVAEFPGKRGWGYDGVDLYAPESSYGGPEGLKQLVDAAHRRGLAVILDVVYNHLGPDGNYLGHFGPYFTHHYRTPWGEAVNFDGPGSDEVRRFFLDNAVMWLRDYHVDGLRLDAVHAIYDFSAIHFFEELSQEVERLSSLLGRRFYLIAESNLNDPRFLRERISGGYGLDAQWNDDFHHAAHSVISREKSGYYQDFGRMADLAKAIEQAFVYDGQYSAYRGRRQGRPARGLSAHQFVNFLQNHDQTGNRAGGDRLNHLVSTDLAKAAAGLLFISPGVPMLFMGEEWAASSPFLYFTDHHDPDLARAVSEGRRKEFTAFGWDPADVPDPQDPKTFERSRLNWDERTLGCHAEMVDWYSQLIKLRKEQPSLTSGFGQTQVHFSEGQRWMVVERGRWMAVFNLVENEQEVPLPRQGNWQVALSSPEGGQAGQSTIRLPGQAFYLLSE